MRRRRKKVGCAIKQTPAGHPRQPRQLQGEHHLRPFLRRLLLRTIPIIMNYTEEQI